MLQQHKWRMAEYTGWWQRQFLKNTAEGLFCVKYLKIQIVIVYICCKKSIQIYNKMTLMISPNSKKRENQAGVEPS